ncbi:hypothetical protein KUCAC02_013624 [Chaenocephalus aceratus]|uniref:Uncharacterized protein n=1 Tax=Chaenocephalus aceratus TaxID=36190 RepID=A0ACB9WCC3_CHAAC|nr:hypothetical protein KUCAC02_013624 [Chaenocephalus aceratus]
MPQHNMESTRSPWQRGPRPPWITRVAEGHSPASSGAESDTESSSTERSERVWRRKTEGERAEGEVRGEGETDPQSAREPERTAHTAAEAGERGDGSGGPGVEDWELVFWRRRADLMRMMRARLIEDGEEESEGEME